MTNTGVITITQIKAQIKRVNSGRNVDADYINLRRLQKDFVKGLTRKKQFNLQSSTLRHLNVEDFPEGVMLRIRKYRIDCNGSQTRVWHVETFKDLRISQMPFYIREFLGV